MSDGARKTIRGAGTLRLAITLVGLAVPTLSLIPLGSLWLWQRGYLLHWALAACVATGVAYGIAARLLPRHEDAPTTGANRGEQGAGDDDGSFGSGLTPREAEAWRAVREIAAGTDPDRLASRENALAVAVEVVERVAAVMRPGVTDPVWHFTAPEVLALTGEVSRRLRDFVEQSVPLGDRLTIAQALRLYRWRGVFDTASSVYDIWRLVRLANPLTAVTHEMRERLSRQLYQWSREHVARRIAETFVQEVGRAAIELYGGRLRAVEARPFPAAGRATEPLPPTASDISERPLRMLVAGQTNAGKSSLVNALAAEAGAAVDVVPTTRAFTAHRITRDGLAGAEVVDSPGLDGATPAAIDEVVEQAAACDLVLWTVAAHRADREPDRAALAALRRHFADRPDRRPPPVLLVLSYIDQLRPWAEWQPPYDIAEPKSVKAQSIRDAAVAAADDLSIGLAEVVPVCLAASTGTYNVDVLWARILDLAPEARQARLVRLLREDEAHWRWRRLWSQAIGAGRVVAGEVARAVGRAGPRPK